MSVDANKQLYRRWLLELWNGDLTIADQVVTPAGTQVSFSGHDLLRVDRGRFAEYWVISEQEHLMAQLQVDPS
jgi:hypothetical protein